MKIFSRKGFTLVEVIVVLVILAILAAIIVPSMTGWIDRARDSGLIADCRSCVLAVQGLASEKYADGGAVDLAEAKTLAEVKGTISGVTMGGANATDVEHLTYTLDGRSVTYCREPNSCTVHSETYTIDGASVSGISGKISSAGDSLKSAYETLPSNLKYNRIDSVAASRPGSAAEKLLEGLSAEQNLTMDDYVWCVVQQTEGFRVYLAPKTEAVTGTTFDMYKYNPETGKFQISKLGRISDDGKLTLPSGWGEWVDSIG